MASRKTNKSGKRKLLADPVAAAALDALSSSSSSSSSEDEDDAPIVAPKKKPSASSNPAKKKTDGKGEGGAAKNCRRHLKTLFERGDEVYSAFWESAEERKKWEDGEEGKKDPGWFAGKVVDYREEENDSPYGPTRYYDIEFDDGDEIDDIGDHLVYHKADYELSMRNDGNPDCWIGVEHKFKDIEGDKWAKYAGWFVTTIGGEEKEFPLLADAMDAYDNQTVQRKGKKTKRSDLNCPEKWSWLFEQSDSNVRGDDDYAERKKDTKKKKRKKEAAGHGPKKRKGSQTGTNRNDSDILPPVAESAKKQPPEEKGKKGDGYSTPSKRPKVASSDYSGVKKQGKKYLAHIDHGGKQCSLGLYKCEADAALAYDKAHHIVGDGRPHNFSSRQEYARAIEGELGTVDAEESYKTVVDKVGVYLHKMMAMDAKPKKQTKNSHKGLDDNSKPEGSASKSGRERAGERSAPKTNDSSVASKHDKVQDEGSCTDGSSNKSTTETAQKSPARPEGPVSNEDRQCEKPSPVGTKSQSQSKRSVYTGVTFNRRSERYLAQIRFRTKSHFVGYWNLEVDAALAHDEAAKLLGADCGTTNFASWEDYTTARAKELGKNDMSCASSVESLAAVKIAIKKQLSKISCPTINVMQDAMANKWAKFLPSATGKEYLESYQKEVDEMLGFTTPQRSKPAPSIVSTGMESDPQVENPNAFFKPIDAPQITPPQLQTPSAQEDLSDDDASLFSSTEEVDVIPNKKAPQNTPPQLQTHSAPEDLSDDDASLFSSTEEVAAIPDKKTTPSARELDFVDSLPSDTNNGNATVTAEQLEENTKAASQGNEPDLAEFPIGCPVVWHCVGKTFRSGVIASVLEGSSYKVTPTTGSRKTGSSTQKILAKELAFGLRCPVYVSSTQGDKEHLVQGTILMFTSSSSVSPAGSLLYTILIAKEANRFEVIKDISPGCVQYRKVAEADGGTRNIAPVGGKKAQGPSSGLGTTNSYHTAAEENESQSSQQFFSSNSTITTVDSVPASSKVIVDGTRCRDGSSGSGSSVSCRLYFPQWLVRDRASNRQLHSHLLQVNRGSGNYMSLPRIGERTNCALRIEWEGRPHVLIQTKPRKYATEDMRRASIAVENSLLEYINHDNSKGRLFYDMALSCKYLHPTAGNSSVMQRNPFSNERENGWMNIVELPFLEGNRKQYHGHHLISKSAGVLGRIKRETNCEIKICGVCGNETQYCAPYVCVIGEQQGRVDRAVELIKEANHHHIRECRCGF